MLRMRSISEEIIQQLEALKSWGKRGLEVAQDF